MKKYRIICILGVAFVPGILSAQNDATLSLERKLLEAIRFQENQKQERGQITKIVQGALAALFSEIDAHGKLHIPEERKAKVLELTSIPEEAYEELDDEKQLSVAGDIYAKQFTQEEMRQIIDFYKSPAGAKLARLQWEIDQQIAMATLDMDNSALRKRFQKHQREVLAGEDSP